MHPVNLIILLSVMLIAPAVAEDVGLGNYTIYICREGTANLTWTPPAGSHSYNLIDLFYTRKPEDGKTYKQITLLSWLPSREWGEPTTDPLRFAGRIRATSQTATTNFVLENVVRIDNGKYELSAATADRKTFIGTYNLIIYIEDNYFPKWKDTEKNNVTDTAQGAESSTYTYTWNKPDNSPSIGVKMLPSTEEATMESKSCLFEDQTTCDVVFSRDEWNVVGRVTFDVEYLFPDTFKRCKTLDIPPTNLIIDIPFQGRLSSSTMVWIIVACIIMVVIACVVPALIIWRIKHNKTNMSLKECLDFVVKCVDAIQTASEASDLAGLYRRHTQESVIKAYIIEYKGNKNNREDISRLFEDIPNKDLASCVLHIFRIAKEKWLPPDVQLQISRADTIYRTQDGSFDAEAVRTQFKHIGEGKSAVYKREILAVVFRHFDWFLTTTARYSAYEMSEVVDKAGLARCIAPNFFRDVPIPDFSIHRIYDPRWNQFISHVIDNFNQVFPRDDDPVGAGDMTVIPLLPV